MLADDQQTDAVAAQDLAGPVGHAHRKHLAVCRGGNLGHEERHELQLVGEMRHRLQLLRADGPRCVGRACLENVREFGPAFRRTPVPPTDLDPLHRAAAFAVQERCEGQIVGAFVVTRLRAVRSRFDHAALFGGATADGSEHEVALRLIRIVEDFRAVRAAQRNKIPPLQKPEVRSAGPGELHQGVQIGPIILLRRDLSSAQFLQPLQQVARGLLMPARSHLRSAVLGNGFSGRGYRFRPT